eukprot:13803516-Alexandrium_andersonii.AAC.1
MASLWRCVDNRASTRPSEGRATVASLTCMWSSYHHADLGVSICFRHSGRHSFEDTGLERAGGTL